MFVLKQPGSRYFNQVIIRDPDPRYVGSIVGCDLARAKRFPTLELAEAMRDKVRRLQADRPSYARNRLVAVEVTA